MASEALAECLEGLSSALERLDHDLVSRYADQLETLRGTVPAASQAEDAAVLAFRLRRAVELTAGASRLYSGWARMASPSGDAYTCQGTEPALRGSASVKMEG
jgi:hypothetical protein